MTQIADFGTLSDGTPIKRIELAEGNMDATVLTYGAVLQSLRFKGTDVVLGYGSVREYESRSGRMGAVIGRFANRISNGRLELDGKTYQLTKNRGEHHIHGGERGFDKHVWDIIKTDRRSVTLRIRSPDGDEGYPGNLEAEVTYALSQDSLSIGYLAHSDMTTAVNLTNHSYFNLDGGRDIKNHTAAIAASYWTETDNEGIPTGRILPVEGRYDLREPTVIGKKMPENGYDTDYLLDGTGFRQFATVSGPEIGMTVSTDLPAVQFYTAGGLKDGTPGKNGSVYGRFSGLCLETQFCPDSPNRPEFPQCTLHTGEVFSHRTEYLFRDLRR